MPPELLATLSAMILAPGATPTVPTPLAAAAMMPATCVPCSAWGAPASGLGFLSPLPKSQPLQSSTKPFRSSSTPLVHDVSPGFVQIWEARSG